MTLIKLTKLVGTKGIDTLKQKNQTWKLSEADLFDSALVIAQTFKLKSLLETTTKYQGSPFQLDAQLDLVKTENTWAGKLVTKSSTLEIKKMSGDDLTSAVIALSGNSINCKPEVVDEVKMLATAYKPKSVSIVLKGSKYDCFVCKSEIKLAEGDIKLCQCLDPLQSSDVLLTKSGEKTKLELSDRADPSQLRFIIKLITKSLLKNSSYNNPSC